MSVRVRFQSEDRKIDGGEVRVDESPHAGDVVFFGYDGAVWQATVVARTVDLLTRVGEPQVVTCRIRAPRKVSA